MSGSRVVFDGLWRCLCPSIDTHAAAARLLSSPALLAPSRATRHRFAAHLPARHHAVGTQRRGYKVSAAKVDASKEQAEAAKRRLASARKPRRPPDEDQPGLDETLRAASVSSIYEVLDALRGTANSFKKVSIVITHLVTERDAELTPALYEHLMIAAADVQGSAVMLAQVLSELTELSIVPSPAICHAALAVLSIHPDYLLRNEILAVMKRTWTEVSPKGEGHIVLGLLRDGQYELALDQMESLITDGVPLEPWVYDIVIFMFAQMGFVDEAVRLAHSRAHISDTDTHLSLWYMLLDICSQEYHYEGTRYIWGRMLDSDRKNLSEGVLVNIINTAAKRHDYELVTNANRLIAERGGKLLVHHYEPLIDCYSGIGDIEGALRVLCIMFNALSIAPYAGTRSMFEWIRRHPDSLDPALEAVTLLKPDYKIPIAALNVLIEAAVETHGFEKAWQIYKNSETYTEALPNHVTLRYLLRACINPETLRALVAADPGLALKADRQVFVDAIFEHIAAGELDLAYKCVGMLGEAHNSHDPRLGRPEIWLDQNTVLALVKMSLDAQDQRVWWLIEQAEKRQMDVQPGLAKIMASFTDQMMPTTSVSQQTEILDAASEPQYPSTA